MTLTTITPYWNRREQLLRLIKCLEGAAHPEVCHIIYIVGDEPLMLNPTRFPNFRFMRDNEWKNQSIGHYHNLGAAAAKTEWVMKLDVDALPNVEFFSALVEKLKAAKQKEWFNVGMFYVKENYSTMYLSQDQLPLRMIRYFEVLQNKMRMCSGIGGYNLPAASNFVCRREDYLTLGGCLPAFKGYGWEDYQQLYMLERHWLGMDPLPGVICRDNVTRRCRDEISRRKAHELWKSDTRLSLLHYWHKSSTNPLYRSASTQNRLTLLDYVLKSRQLDAPKVAH